ncbi:MAG: FHA domain-containing protein [Deltaproteobacteria bacterium]|nr:FHA domain-containing protein [Deltaproteobacteria bacterium]
MANRDKAAVGDFEGDLGREPLRGEQTTIDDSYLDGLSSKLDSEPRLVAPPARPVTKRGNGSLPPDAPLIPDVALSPTGPVRKMAAPEEEEELEEIEELGSFDAKPIPSEPTQIEEEDELAAVATKIFVGDDAEKVAKLEVVAGRDRGKSFPLSAETTCVGRGIDNDVILTDIAVSRRHLKVHRRDGYWELEDLGSGNGSIRNGKKVRGRVVLLAGDRLELGNTTFLFAWDGVPPPGALESTSALDMSGPMPAIPAKGKSVPVRAATEQIPRPPAPTGIGPNKLIIFGGAGLGVLLIALIVIVKLTSGPSAQDQAVPVGPSVTELQTTGVNAYTGRQWDVALASFEQLAKLAPNDPSVRDYITRCQEERQAEQVLAQVRLLAASNPGGAITSLAGIPPTSVYAAEAAALRNEVTVRRVGQLLALIQTARQEATPDTSRILGLVDEGLTLDHGNAQLQQIRTEVASAMPAEPAPAGVPAAGTEPAGADQDQTPSGASGPTKVAAGRPGRHQAPAAREPQQRAPAKAPAASNSRVLQLYRSGRFREAADAAAGIAESASGRAADQARALSRDVDRFSQAWSAAQAARGQPSAIRNLESALRLDRSISGGHYAAQIQPLLLAAHAQNATRAWQSGRYASACVSVQAALRIDSSSSAVSRMSRDCAAKARDLYEQAYAMRTSDPNRARELWRQVLQMVSRDNEYYGRAYERLNNSPGAGGRDEDE